MQTQRIGQRTQTLAGSTDIKLYSSKIQRLWLKSLQAKLWELAGAAGVVQPVCQLLMSSSYYYKGKVSLTLLTGFIRNRIKHNLIKDMATHVKQIIQREVW